MCLTLREKSEVPYKRTSKIRWKFIKRRTRDACYRGYSYVPEHTYANEFKSPYQGKRITFGRWLTAEGNKNRPEDFGFHVFMSKRGALKFQNTTGFQDSRGNLILVPVRVSGFLRSGSYDLGYSYLSGTVPCETYRRIYYPKYAQPKILKS